MDLLILLLSLLIDCLSCEEVAVRATRGKDGPKQAASRLLSAINASRSDTTLVLYGTGRPSVFMFKGFLEVEHMDAELTIKGSGPRTLLVGQRSATMVIHGSGKLVLDSLDLFGVTIATNTHVSVRNCTLKHSNIYQVTTTYDIHLELANVTWSGISRCREHRCESSSKLIVRGKVSKVNITDCKFEQTTKKIMVNNTQSEVDIHNSKIINRRSAQPVYGCIRIYLQNSSRSVVSVSNSLFEGQMQPNPILSSLNIAEGALRIKRIDNDPTNVADIQVVNTSFLNNERGLSVEGGVTSIRVENCSFIANKAVHAGAGILLLTEKYTTVDIRRCVFKNNAAGIFPRRPQDVLNSNTSKLIYGRHLVQVSAKCCKGKVQPLGKGGAIRINAGKATISDSVFSNNSANTLGGAIFVEANASVYMKGVTIKNVGSQDLISPGDVIYSTGSMVLAGVLVDVAASLDHVPLIRHTGDDQSVKLENFELRCPLQYTLKMSSSPGLYVGNQGDSYAAALDELIIYCSLCSGYTYTLQNGEFHLNGSGKFMYLKNSSTENQHSFMRERTVVCHECPFGARCDGKIRPRDNFWGYEQEERAQFIRCRPGHCCTDGQCYQLNSCASSRTGTLCTTCKKKTLMDPFSGECIPVKDCRVEYYPLQIVIVVVSWLFLALVASCSLNYRRVDVYRNDDGISVELETLSRETSLTSDAGTYSASGETQTNPRNKKSGESACSFIVVVYILFYMQDVRLYHASMSETTLNGYSYVTWIISKISFIFTDLVPPTNLKSCVSTMSSSLHIHSLHLAVVGLLLVPVYCAVAVVSCARRGVLRNTRKLLSYISWFLTFTLAQRLILLLSLLIRCVTIRGHHLLYLDSSVTCLQPWQTFLLCYLPLWTLGALIVMGAAGSKFNPHKQSVMQSVISWWLPLPYLVQLLRTRKNPSTKVTSSSFIRRFGTVKWQMNWLGFLLFFRFTQAVSFSFVLEPLVRSLCMACSTFLLLLLQVHLKPESNKVISLVSHGTVITTILVAGISTVRMAVSMDNGAKAAIHITIVSWSDLLLESLCVGLPTIVLVILIIWCLTVGILGLIGIMRCH